MSSSLNEREAGFLQGGEVSPYRALGDAQLSRKIVDGAAMGEIVEVKQQLPLADDFGVAWHVTGYTSPTQHGNAAAIIHLDEGSRAGLS